MMCHGLEGQADMPVSYYRQTSAKWFQLKRQAFALASMFVWLVLSAGCFWMPVGLVEGHNTLLPIWASWNPTSYNQYLRVYDDALGRGEEMLVAVGTWIEANLLASLVGFQVVIKQLSLDKLLDLSLLWKWLLKVPFGRVLRMMQTLWSGDFLKPASNEKPSYSECIRPLHCFQGDLGVEIEQFPPFLALDVFAAGSESLYALTQSSAEQLKFPELKHKQQNAEGEAEEQAK